MEFAQADLLGFSMSSSSPSKSPWCRPAIVRRLVLASSAPKSLAGHAWLGGRGDRRGRHAAHHPGGLPGYLLTSSHPPPSSRPCSTYTNRRPDTPTPTASSYPNRAQYNTTHLGGPRTPCSTALHCSTYQYVTTATATNLLHARTSSWLSFSLTGSLPLTHWAPLNKTRAVRPAQGLDRPFFGSTKPPRIGRPSRPKNSRPCRTRFSISSSTYHGSTSRVTSRHSARTTRPIGRCTSPRPRSNCCRR